MSTILETAPPPATYPEESLRLLKDRDARFLEKQFRTINPVLLRILAANRIFGEHAEDITHQTWEKFFQNLEKFEGRSGLQTFVCGILINKIREYRRSQNRMVLEEDAEAVFSNAFTTEGWWSLKSQDPSALLKSTELAQHIGECLEGLTEAQRSAFVLKEVENEDSTEICNALGVSVSNLRVLIFRAKDKLRKCLEGKVDVSDGVRP